MLIDLGEIQKADVKIGASSYKVDVPSVKQAQEYQKCLGKGGDDEINLFLDFLNDLGLPREVGETLSIHQLTKLVEGLMGDAKKK